MQEANRNTDLMLQAKQILKDAETLGFQTLEVLSKRFRKKKEIFFFNNNFNLGDSSLTISKTIDKYILNEHLIHTSRDLITQYERKAKYEKLIIVALLVIFFAVALNIIKKRLLW
jgi:hypothetical protein